MRTRYGVGAVAALAVFTLIAAPAEGAPKPKITVLSNRADLISGGDALVEINAPKGEAAKKRRMILNGKPVKKRFAKRANGRFQGIVRGIENGKQRPHREGARRPAAKVKILNHPNGSPVFAGLQVQPWECQDGAVDEQCNQPPSSPTSTSRKAGGGTRAGQRREPAR